jgi:hypothetical protein
MESAIQSFFFPRMSRAVPRPGPDRPRKIQVRPERGEELGDGYARSRTAAVGHWQIPHVGLFSMRAAHRFPRLWWSSCSESRHALRVESEVGNPCG